nr:calpain-8 isoform X2 [Camelus dromedarius]
MTKQEQSPFLLSVKIPAGSVCFWWRRGLRPGEGAGLLRKDPWEAPSQGLAFPERVLWIMSLLQAARGPSWRINDFPVSCVILKPEKSYSRTGSHTVLFWNHRPDQRGAGWRDLYSPEVSCCACTPSPAPGTRGWVSSAAEAEAITSQKLVKSHAYSITGVEEVDSRGRPERLIRLRNPWGEVEWTGAWSDDAPEWNYIAPRQKEELYKKVEDGEFWMSFSDFLRQFSRLEICNLSPDSLSSKEVHKWNLVLFNGRWTRGCTAGGCQNYPATYWTNPQFEIRLDEVDDHQEEGAGEPCCTVLLGLMQKNRRRQKRMGQGMLSIGYAVYKVPKEREGPAAAQLGRDFFQGRQPSARSATYVNLREVSARVRLPPGPYVVVPATFEPFKDGDFCLRVFSEKKAKALEIGDVVAGNPHEPHPCEVDQEDGQFERLFEKLAGKDSEVSASELKTALNEVFSKRTDIKFDGFDINTCREMISLMDSNGTGSLGLLEFKTLWLKIQKYLEIYREMDYNHLGTIDAHEMRAALKKAGFTLNNQVQQTIATRYAGSKLCVDFDGFVACMIRLETLFKLFRLLDKDQSGIVRLSLAEWLCCALV